MPIAVFTSASSNTSAAPLPPSSSSWRFIPRPADLADAASRPPVEPVKLTMSMSGDSTSASPVAGRRAGDDVDDAGREADVVEELHELDDRERVLAGGPHDDGVAHRERRAELADHVHDREVVRRDARDRRRPAARRASAPISPPGASAVAGISCGGSGSTRRLERAARRSARSRVAAIGTCICLPTVVGAAGLRDHERDELRRRAPSCASAAACSSAARSSGVVCDHAGERVLRGAAAASRACVGRRLGRVGRRPPRSPG